MAAQAHVLISSQTLGSAAASVTFSTISGSYRDLRLVVNSSATPDGNVGVYVNGDTASNYSQVNMRGYGSGSVASSSSTGGAINSNYNTGSGTGIVVNTYDFLDYAQTDKHKTILIRANHSGEIDSIAGRWASTSAITSITITSGATFVAGSIFSLYGVLG